MIGMPQGLDSTREGRNMANVIQFPRPEKGTLMSVTTESTSQRDAGDAMDDSEQWGAWMELAQKGDRAAYQSVLMSITPYLRALSRRFLGQEQDAEDVVQEILIVVHDIRHTYEPGRPFKPWLSTIATRRCIDLLRRRTRRLQHEIAEHGELESIGSTIETPEELLSRQQAGRSLKGAVDSLPGRQREAIRLLRLRELSLHEAAAESEQSVGSLKVACHRALKALQRAMTGGGDIP